MPLENLPRAWTRSRAWHQVDSRTRKRNSRQRGATFVLDYARKTLRRVTHVFVSFFTSERDVSEKTQHIFARVRNRINFPSVECRILCLRCQERERANERCVMQRNMNKLCDSPAVLRLSALFAFSGDCVWDATLSVVGCRAVRNSFD